MRLFLLCLVTLPFAGMPQSARSQAVPADSLSSFLAAGASAWDVVAEPDMAAISQREALAQTRDDGLTNGLAANGTEDGKRFDRSPATSVRASAAVIPAPVRQRTRAVTPARDTPPARTSRTFIAPWQTGVFQ
jgi:hypothetical protein